MRKLLVGAAACLLPAISLAADVVAPPWAYPATEAGVQREADPIAGLHPVYIVRQLLDIQQGSRDGAATQLMKGVVAKLNEDDMVNIAAYVSSRTP